MKKAFFILITTAIMLPNLKEIGVFVDFKINQDFIAKVLCINREKPMSNCNGKCYLSKQLKEAEEKEKKQAPSNKKEGLELTFYYIKNIFSINENVYFSKINLSYEKELYHFFFMSDIFRPPKF